MAVENPSDSLENQDNKHTTFVYDKHWMDWGTVFIPTSKNGEPFGLMEGSAPNYAHLLCNKDGRVVGEFLRVKKADFRKALKELAKQHKVKEVIAAGVGKDKAGYFMPLGEVGMEAFLTMAGLNNPEQQNYQNYNNTPITITTDGSYRDDDKISAGGRLAIIQRSGSYDYKDDFRMEFGAGAFNIDNTQAELGAIVDALACLDTNYEITRKFKACHTIEIRTDYADIVTKINALKVAIAAESVSPDVPVPSVDSIILASDEKYRDLWKEVAKFMRKHEITVVEVRKTPDAKRCHNGANDARKNFAAIVKKNRTQGITATPREILHFDADKQLLKKTASRFLARDDSARVSPDEETRNSVVPVKYKYSRLRGSEQEMANKVREGSNADMVILDVSGAGLEPGYGLTLAKKLRENGYARPIIVYSGNSEGVIKHYATKLNLDLANLIICSKTDTSVVSMDKLYDTVQKLLKERMATERPPAITPRAITDSKISGEMELQ